jgi:hypothetical protein
MGSQQETLDCVFTHFPRNKFYFVDENNNVGLRWNGSIRWYNWDGIFESYKMIGETNTPQGADKRRIPGR